MKRLPLLLGIGIALLLAGCSKSEKKEKAPDKDVPLQVFPKIGEPFSRTTTDDGGNYIFSDNDEIGLFAVNSGKQPNPADPVYNQRYTYNGTAWTAANSVYWPEGELGSVCKLYAYYPYSPTVERFEQHTFEVSHDQSTPEKVLANDFLHSKSLASKQNTTVALSMKHLFSLLTVHIKYDDHLSDICTGISINARPAALINLETGEATATEGFADLLPAAINEVPEGYTKSFSVILPPQAFDNHSLVTLAFGTEKKTVNVSKQFEAGKHYLMNVSVSNGHQISFEGFFIAPWEETVYVSGGMVSPSELLHTGEVIEYQKNRTDHPVTLVILGDGFTQEHLMRNGLFVESATQAIEFLFDVEPFRTYRDYFNVYFIAAESQEAGGGNTTTGELKNNYFGTKWNDSYSDMSANQQVVFDFVNNYCPDIRNGKIDIDKTTILLLVNDPRYGGICYTWSTGRSYMICPLTGGTLSWQGKQPEEDGISIGDWRNTFLHEGGGHCFGKLTDEYWYDDEAIYMDKRVSSHSWSVPFGKNVTTDISPNGASNFWFHLSENGRYPKVGYWEGAMGYGKNIWRSEAISCMIDNRRYFNAYSRQLIVERIKALAGEPFDLDEFLAKDVNYDEILDGGPARSRGGIYGKNLDLSDIKLYPPLPLPRLMEE